MVALAAAVNSLLANVLDVPTEFPQIGYAAMRREIEPTVGIPYRLWVSAYELHQ